MFGVEALNRASLPLRKIQIRVGALDPQVGSGSLKQAFCPPQSAGKQGAKPTSEVVQVGAQNLEVFTVTRGESRFAL